MQSRDGQGLNRDFRRILWINVDKSGSNTAEKAGPHGQHDQEQAHGGNGDEIFDETSEHHLLPWSIFAILFMFCSKSSQ
jgi:hypothetical protein